MSTLKSASLLARAQLMLEAAAKLASLKIPAQVPGGPAMREMAVNEAAFMQCAAKLIEANPPGVRWLVVLAHVVVAKGREQGVCLDDVITEIADATRQAVEARAKAEAKAEAQADKPPPLIKPN